MKLVTRLRSVAELGGFSILVFKEILFKIK